PQRGREEEAVASADHRVPQRLVGATKARGDIVFVRLELLPAAALDAGELERALEVGKSRRTRQRRRRRDIEDVEPVVPLGAWLLQFVADAQIESEFTADLPIVGQIPGPVCA